MDNCLFKDKIIVQKGCPPKRGLNIYPSKSKLLFFFCGNIKVPGEVQF